MFDQLPDDLKKHVLSYLTLPEKIRAISVNKKTHALMHDEHTWKVFCTFENIPAQKAVSFKHIYLDVHGFVVTNYATPYYVVGNSIQLYANQTTYPFICKLENIDVEKIQSAFPNQKNLSVFLTKADADLFSQSQIEYFQLIPMKVPVVFHVSLQANIIAKKKQVSVDVPGKLYYQNEHHQLTFFSLDAKQVMRGQNEKLGNLFNLPIVMIEPNSSRESDKPQQPAVTEHNFDKSKCRLV